MKRRFLFFLVLAGILFSSCAVDEIPSGEGSISALMENEDTRTSVTDEGAFTWSYGDKVWLETTTGNVTGFLSSGAGTSSAQFSYGAYFGEMTGKAVYPYNSGHSISENVLSVAMPASYNLGSSLDNTNAAMYGVNVGGTLKFSHLAGVMRFKFNNVPAGVNKFTITLDKKINGTFGADLRADYPVIETSATSIASEKTITLTFDALTKTSDICLYVPLPLGTYTSLELGIYDDGQSVWSYSNSVTNTISRKTLKLMPAVTFGGFIGGDIEGGGNTPSEPQEGDYIDEYGINHGQGTRIGETVWAPVNCGYHKDHFKYGKLYQWGRKYGQGYSGDIYDGDWDQTFSDALIPTIDQGRIDVLTGNQKSSADIFYIGTYQYNYDWADSRDDKLWNSGTEDSPVKTGYDPCPDGWRVPTCAELDELNNNYSWSVDENGRNGYWFSGANTYTAQAPQVFFPAAGYRVSSDGYADYRGSFGDYWSSRPNDICAYALVFDSSGGFMEYRGYRASGYSVRCVRE